MTAVFQEGAPDPVPGNFNMAAHVLAPAGRLADKTALAVVGSSADAESWSYDRLERAVLGTAGAILKRGTVPGDRVLLRLGNTVDVPVAYLACIAVGVIPVPVSAMLTPRELSPILSEISPAAVFHDPRLRLPETDVDIVDLETLRSWRGAPPANFQPGDPDRLAYIVYTSGTGGRPRAVAHAHRAVWARRMMIADWCDLRADDRIMHAGAFNWTYTMGTGLMDPWSVGATALIPAEGTEIPALPSLLERHGATLFAAAPGVYRRLLASGVPIRPSRLRHGLSAGEALPEATRELWMKRTGREIYNALGMSECSTYISTSPDRPAPAGSSGRPQRGRRVAVLDAAGDPTDWDRPGQLAIHRGDQGLMKGYWPRMSLDGCLSGEWFPTGDMVRMTREGHVSHLGRADDMMNAGGHRVSPLEVEAAMTGVAGIRSAAAVEVEVKPGASVIALAYVSDAELDADSLAAAAAERLARYKIPRMFVRLGALPSNPNGKIDRRALRKDLRP